MITSSHATGPRTAEGKARSSQNARTHGVTAQTLKISLEDQPLFDALKSSLADELKPAGELESALFDRILRAHWHLRAIDTLESDALVQGDDVKLGRLSLYRSRTENGLYKATNELRKLQEERLLRHAALDSPSSFPALVHVAAVQKSFIAFNRQKKRTPPSSDSDASASISTSEFRYDQE